MNQPIVDAHLDMAWNVLANRRDLRQSVAEIRRKEQQQHDQAQTSLPDMRRAGVGVVFATLFVEPKHSEWLPAALTQHEHAPSYSTPQEAYARALDQLEIYQAWEDEGWVRIIKSQADLEQHLRLWPSDQKPGLVVLMEGADPIRQIGDLEFWWGRGVRIIGLSWSRTRYAGGTGSPGGLTEIGRELVGAMAQMGVIHDVSHLDEMAFWEAMELQNHAIIASHSNPRVLLESPTPTIPLNRHLSDDMIRAIGQAGGVIGLNLINDFLEPHFDRAARTPAVTLQNQVRRHWAHVAGLIGWEKVGIGSDTDASSGKEETPEELDTILDWKLLGQAVPPDTAQGVLGQNWLTLLRRTLPR